MQLEKESQFSPGFYQHARKKNYVGTSSVHSLILRLVKSSCGGTSLLFGLLSHVCRADLWIRHGWCLDFKLKYIFPGFQKLGYLKKCTHTTTG